MKYSARSAWARTSGSVASFVRITRSTPSAPMPACRSHSARTSAGDSDSTASRSGSTTKSFSVPWPLNAVQSGHGPRVGVQARSACSDQVGSAAVQPVNRGRPAGTRIAAGGRNARSARTVSSTASPRSAISSPVVIEHGEQLLIAQRLGRGRAAPQARRQQRPDLVQKALRHHPIDPRLHPLVQVVAIQADLHRPIDRSKAGIRARNGPPVSSMTSSARTIRRPLLGRIAAAAAGSTLGQPGMQRAPVRARPARRSAGPGVSGDSPGNSRWSSAPRRYSPDPPTRIGSAPRPAMSAMAARARPWYSATAADFVTGQTSSRWCGNRRPVRPAEAWPCRCPSRA